MEEIKRLNLTATELGKFFERELKRLGCDAYLVSYMKEDTSHTMLKVTPEQFPNLMVPSFLAHPDLVDHMVGALLMASDQYEQVQVEEEPVH